MKTFPLYIEKLVFGGNGLGRHDGMAVFIPSTVPGDTVRWRVAERKKRFCRGRLLGIITPSRHRVTPECPLFPTCGGCQWQHIEYPEQIRWKQDIFTSALVRGCDISIYDVKPVAPAPSLWNYRRRARLRLAWQNGKWAAGFFRAGSHEMVPVRRCPLLDHRLNVLLESAWQYLLEPGPVKGTVSSMELEAGDSGACRIILDCSRNIKTGTQESLCRDRNMLRIGAEALVKACPFEVAVMVRNGNRLTCIAGKTLAELIIMPVPCLKAGLRLPAGGFFQVNADQNRMLVSLVLHAIKEMEQPARKILDLFCGAGNFTIPLALCCHDIKGIDASEVLIHAAGVNARLNDVCNVTFNISMVDTYLAGMKDAGKYDVVLLDPPRAGALKATTELASARPSTVIYVSCDPMTLARDLKILVHAGYMVRWSMPIDMFPHTYHIESVTVLDYGVR